MSADWPDFINSELVERGLRKYYNDQKLKLSDCEINLVGAKGDNYSSCMCRAKCKFETKGKKKEKKVIVKGLPTATAALKFVKEFNSFDKELKMLSQTLPKLQKILKEIDFNEELEAKFYYVEKEPYYVIMMEDLSEDNFAVKNRREGLTYEEGSKVLKSIAALHVASMVYFQENPEEVNNYFSSAWSKNNRENLQPGLKAAIDTIASNVDSWSEKKWSEKIVNLQKHLPDAFFDVIEKRNVQTPLVINHGDLWLNNMMFREKDQLEVKFVDFQLSWVNSPIFDVIYFIFTSMRKDVRFNKMDDLLKVYQTNFEKYGKEFNLDFNYSYEELKKDFNDKLMFAFVMFAFVYPIVSAPPANAIDLEHEFDDRFNGNPIFFNPIFIENFLLGLDFFEANGLFLKYK